MLIFAIVIAGIGLVTLYGYPLLLQQQISADEKIMEKNMIVLQNDIKSLAYKTVPFKETSLKISGGSLTVYNSSHSSPSSAFRIFDANNDDYITSYNAGELRYESVNSQTDISLQNGAVVLRRHVEAGSVMLAEPRWFYDTRTNTLVVNLITINSTDLMSKEGIGTVQMELVGEPYYNETIFSAPNPAPDPRLPMRIDYTKNSVQDYSVAWDNYFTHSLKISPDPVPHPDPMSSRYILPLDPNKEARLVIKKFVVNIKSI